ncbi:MAG: riboflavin biosynthesis protein RibF [Planctomycetota bacterium]|nr:riboflavin biosynthesis protein RibF [Planctomycetota bacterium]
MPSVVTLGVFDGMHRGHQAVIQEAVAWSRTIGVRSVVVTFATHPATILAGRHVPFLQTLSDRLDHMQSMGIDLALPLPFDRAMASQPPKSFVQTLLIERLGARGILLGHDTTFGKSGIGNLQLLKTLEATLNFEARGVEPVLHQGAPISSTRIRNQVARGDLLATEEMLGRPFTTRGKVVRGDQRGRTIGFPTANIHPQGSALPPPGVYGGSVHLPEGSRYALINIGFRPTFTPVTSDSQPTIEAHLLDWEGDLYDSIIEIEWLIHLREEIQFDTETDLANQILNDRSTFESFLHSSA